MPLSAASESLSTPGSVMKSVIGRGLIHSLYLLIAVAAFGAYEHFRLHGQSTASIVSLLTAAGFGFAPVRALAAGLLAMEGRIMHLMHGFAGLAFLGLVFGGKLSGGPILTQAAMAPFAIMGAAQAVMHQDHPRNAEQAAALRRFATSLPEVERFTKSGDLTSPANVRRAIAVLSDLTAKAQALGETELRSDPGFQSALRRTTTRFGLSLALDTVDRALGRLSANPAAAGALPGLRRRLAAARKTVE